jgi:hypothetical protein
VLGALGSVRQSLDQGRHISQIPRVPGNCNRATCPVSAFNLAKVGVEGSNPFARSNFLQINQRHRRTVEGFVCFPAAGPEAGEAEGKQPKAKRPAIMP